MPNQYKNKVVYSGQTLIDLTADTLDANKVLAPYTGHDATGAPFVGSIINGDEIEYGLTDGTLPLAGVAKVGSAVI